jgi:hypothetical protein
MSNTTLQIKRTSISGRAANSSTLTSPGELALNMADGILYSTNGSIVFEIGANNTNARVSNTLIITRLNANGTLGLDNQILTSNGTVAYWANGGFSNGQSISVSNLTITDTTTVANTASIIGAVATVANTAETTIATFSSTAFRSAKLVVQVKDTVTNQSQISELLLTHNTVDVFATEYGVVHSSANALATFDVYLISNTISLTAERDTSNSTEYKTYLTMMLT